MPADFVNGALWLTRVVTALAVGYFSLNLVFSAGNAQAGAVSGRTDLLAEFKDRMIWNVLGLCLVAGSGPLAHQVIAIAQSSGQSPTQLWLGITTFVVQAVIWSAGAGLTVGLAAGMLSAQIHNLAGSIRLSDVWGRLIAVMLTFLLTLASSQLINAIVTALF